MGAPFCGPKKRAGKARFLFPMPDQVPEQLIDRPGSVHPFPLRVQLTEPPERLGVMVTIIGAGAGVTAVVVMVTIARPDVVMLVT